MLKTLRYIFISLTLLIANSSIAQEAPIPATRTHSIALGIDLAPFILKGFDNNRTGVIVSGRYGLKEKYFATAELGYENIEFNKNKDFPNSNRVFYDFNYKSNGSFLRFGIDYNFFNVDEPGNNDNVLFGIRYGLALQEHNSSSYTIGNGYWEDYSGNEPHVTVTTHWVELVFGIRAEILKNLYMGWAVRGKSRLASQSTSIMEPYAVPGLGKVENGVAFGFSYSIEYQIPFGKKRY